MKRRDWIAGAVALGAAKALGARRVAAKGPKPLVLSGQVGPVGGVEFSPDGCWLASSASVLSHRNRGSAIGGETRLWDARDGQMKPVARPPISGNHVR